MPITQTMGQACEKSTTNEMGLVKLGQLCCTLSATQKCVDDSMPIKSSCSIFVVGAAMSHVVPRVLRC